MVTKPVRAAVKKAIPKSLPENLTMGSAKFGTTYTPAERRSMARTMLDEKVLPNQAGYDKVAGIQKTLTSHIDAIIDRAQATGGSVPLSALTSELPELVMRSSRPTLSSADDLREIFRVVDEYTQQMQSRGITQLTPRDLQDFKVNAYQQINWRKLADPKSLPPVAEETMSRMARAARKEIEGMAPEIAPVNERYGRLAELREPLARSINRIDNRDLIGIGAPLKTVTGAVTGGPGGTLLGALAGAVDAPMQKARIAQMLERGRVNNLFAPDASYNALLRQLAAESGSINALFANQ
jgi:hypothetical protein